MAHLVRTERGPGKQLAGRQCAAGGEIVATTTVEKRLNGDVSRVSNLWEEVRDYLMLLVRALRVGPRPIVDPGLFLRVER